MTKIADIKKKLAAIDHPGVKALILELIMDHDSDIGAYDQEAGPIGYGRYVERILEKMKTRYKKQLKKEDKVVPRDLENLIQDIKDGVEPEWKNKCNQKKEKH